MREDGWSDSSCPRQSLGQAQALTERGPGGGAGLDLTSLASACW